MTKTCLHCGGHVSREGCRVVTYRGIDHAVCGPACSVAAQRIIAGGQADYYRFRDAPLGVPNKRATDSIERWEAFDVQAGRDNTESAEADVIVEGVRCGACAWLIEEQLGRLPGVDAVQLDQASGYLSVRWQPQTARLSTILHTLAELGFTPHPIDRGTVAALHGSEQRDLIKRLGVAGLGAMQVMMYVVGTYFGPERGMDPAIERLLLTVSMMIAAAVVCYSGSPFFVSAWRSLRARRLNMDVPVAIALVLAFTASCINYFRGAGPTYFESVSMFVLFLLASRFVALRVRYRATQANLALAPLLPDSVIRLGKTGDEWVARSELAVGDRIRVRPGDAVAADGIIENGNSALDESLLTGESTPVARRASDPVLAGSINVNAPLTVQVTAVAESTRVAQTAGLLARARQVKPERVQTAQRVAGYFVGSILLLAGVVFVAWLPSGIEHSLSAALAVLVVTCPCALSLAIPTALSAATTRLARDGILVSNPDVLEKLNDLDLALFDKTGTLSRGEPTIVAVETAAQHPNPVTESQLLSLVAALERQTSHPIANAFQQIRPAGEAIEVKVSSGQGVAGRVAGRSLRVGSVSFTGAPSSDTSTLTVADESGVLGAVTLADAWRSDAKWFVQRLGSRGVLTTIVSGDRQQRVNRAVQELELDEGIGDLQPSEKLEYAKRQQANGRRILAIGDGVNDTGLLGVADVSVALASGADLAQASSDVVITGPHLSRIGDLIRVGGETQRIVRQNLAWAIAYNAIAVPLAALGYVGPAIAALGMSVSSLVVVLNGARLLRRPAGEKPAEPTAASAAPAFI